jgi:glycosyltransferase involved in cell wall biosynthesis
MFALIIPVYKNQENIPSLLEAVKNINSELSNKVQIVFVVDGSPDNSFNILNSSLAEQPFESVLIELSRNFGSFQAIRAGLESVGATYYAVMAADLQEPPSLIIDIFKTLEKREYDLVVGQRESREDSFFSTLFSNIFWKLYRKIIFPSSPKGGLDVFGCNKVFRDHLLTFKESNSSLVGQLLWLGFRRKELPYARQKRLEGTSAWTLSKKIRYLLDSLFSFTDLPIMCLIALGVFSLLLSFGLICLVIFSRLIGQIHVPGYTTTISIVCLFAGLNSLGLGVVGIYAWRAYENTKERPLSVIMTKNNFLGSQ